MKKHQDEQIKTAFTKVKEEMTDHLDAINENTNEINSTSNYVKELEKKINKLNEKIEDFSGAFNEALTLNKPVIIDVVVESEVYPPFSLSRV